eukprot:scaffold125335_cov29-Prasinocladus_malaysianus.AAC.2
MTLVLSMCPSLNDETALLPRSEWGSIHGGRWCGSPGPTGHSAASWPSMLRPPPRPEVCLFCGVCIETGPGPSRELAPTLAWCSQFRTRPRLIQTRRHQLGIIETKYFVLRRFLSGADLARERPPIVSGRSTPPILGVQT